MNNIPIDLNRDINGIKEPEKKTLVRVLIIAVMALSGVIGVLFAIVIKESNSLKGGKDAEIRELKQDLKEARVGKVRADSLYTDAIIKLVRTNQEFNSREEKFNVEISKTLKTQDSLLSIFKK